MCRLLLWTDTTTSRSNIVNIVDRALMLSAAEGNHHGWGVCTNKVLYKRGESYIYRDSMWLDNVLQHEYISPVIGHVRAASIGTSITPLEAQPFMYKADSKILVGVHNGTFYRSWNKNNVPLSSPHSDTYRAFHRLHQMLAGGWVSADLIEDWLSAYEKRSSFAVILRQGNKIVAFRNSKRMLYYSYIGNGVFVTTSLNVAKHIRQIAEDMTEPIPLEDNVLWHINTENTNISGERLSFDAMLPTRGARRDISMVKNGRNR